ncbi:hypothetical protein [Puniceibacterium sediminis]|uniref:Aspartate carbamoyltransferase catalytic subunit n=1 Tax=Puniceibacterium sediminis TaxID=1608407 RepID=A0A238WK69_9RHOB|nr:hypothetical protein [Puniceibacterium sediminis]SNR46976.1 hypothetical protein SAMN06265370_10692 [Puniceibacterium sediminis]
MTRMAISDYEIGLLRVFVIDLPSHTIEHFANEAATGEWPLRDALGASLLRGAYVETVAIDDLGAMTLSSYLAEGYGLTGEDFRAARPQLDALSGHVLLLPSAAFGQVEQSLKISPPLRWIGTFSEETRPAELTPLRSKSARGRITDGRASPSWGDLSQLSGPMLGLGIVLLAILLFAIGVRR